MGIRIPSPPIPSLPIGDRPDYFPPDLSPEAPPDRNVNTVSGFDRTPNRRARNQYRAAKAVACLKAPTEVMNNPMGIEDSRHETIGIKLFSLFLIHLDVQPDPILDNTDIFMR